MKPSKGPEKAMEISCRITRTLLLYVREQNAGSLGGLLDGLALDEDYLSDPHNWVSHAFLQDLYARMIALLKDENAVYHMTLASGRLRSLGILERIARLIGSPRIVYQQADRYNRFLKLNGSVVVRESGPDWVVIEDRYHDGAQKTRYDCDYTRGLLTGIPTIFGLPPARIQEITCQVDGAVYGPRPWPDSPPQGCSGCRYHVRWKRPKQAWLRSWLRRPSEYRQAIEDLVAANALIQSQYDALKRLSADIEQTNRKLRQSKRDLERKQAELIESEGKYRLLAENASDIIWILDLHSLRFNYISPSVEALRGFTPEEAKAMSLEQSLSPASLAQVTAILESELGAETEPGADPKRSRRIEIEQSVKTGGYTWAEATVSFLRDPDGSPTAILGATRDISERRQAQRRIAESEEKYRELFQHAPAGIYEFDMRAFRFTRVNDVMCEYSGYSREEFLALDPVDLVCEESRETLARLLADVAAHRPGELAAEYKILGKNQKEFWVLSNSRFFYEDGVATRAMAVVHDLTEIRRAQEEKKRLEARLQNAGKLESLGTLAGGVAHDLNNILSGIVSYPDLLLMDLAADSPLREPLVRMRNSGQRAAQIVQDLLTLARRSVAVKKALSLNRIVNDFLASPEFDQILDHRPDIALETVFCDGVLTVMGSEPHLAKTLMNLVANAADAMPAGGLIRVCTRNCYLDAPHAGFEVIPRGEYVVLEVSDGGIGMGVADLGKIFEPFYTKKALGRSGTGLGMTVVWGTVKDHDGFIDVSTAEGEGTRFSLYFPASRSEIEAPETVPIDDYLGRGESLMVVDDEPQQRDILQRMLGRLGYRVDAAESGEAALAMIARRTYDLLILDMIMPPGMDGLETYRRILEIAPGQRAIIASGYSETERVREAQRLGAGSYVKKPFTLETIGLAVRAELDRVSPPAAVRGRKSRLFPAEIGPSAFALGNGNQMRATNQTVKQAGLPDPLERYRDLVDDPQAFMAASRRPLPHFLWTNALRTYAALLAERLRADGFDPRPLAWDRSAFRVPADRQGLGRHWTYLAGHFQIQEASAMVPVRILNPQPGERILDLCAAPGNKTVQAAVAMQNTGTVVGNDLNCGRLSPLRQSVDRLGLFNVTITCHDGVNFPGRAGPFDRVLADVPCSCEGTSRRHGRIGAGPTAPYERFGHKQILLLAQAVRRCRPGGRIVYSTCTYAPEENEAVVDAVCKLFGGTLRLLPFELPGLKATCGLTAWEGRRFAADLVHSRRIWPHHNDSGGFFIALLERSAGPHGAPPPGDIGDQAAGAAVGDLQHRSLRREDILATVARRFGIPDEALRGLEVLENRSQVAFVAVSGHRPPCLTEQTSGLKFMHLRPRFPILTTGAAAAFGAMAVRNTIQMTADQCRAYLRREPFTPSAGQLAVCDGTGYVLVRYEEAVLGVGFYGAGEGRVASLFPKSMAVVG